tara:strand:- start:551 stop:1888 length:1338 start_codon:yes stop_codon:yes gene_type:complete
MAENLVEPTIPIMQQVYNELDTVNTVDIRNFIKDIYNNWINIYPYFYPLEVNKNVDLKKSGFDFEKSFKECSKIIEMSNGEYRPEILPQKQEIFKEKIIEIIDELKKIYGKHVDIYLYNNNLDSRNVGRTAHMSSHTNEWANGGCKIFAYIKSNAANQEFVTKNEMEHVRIFHCNSNKIFYLKEIESGTDEQNKQIYQVNPSDYLVFDNHFHETDTEVNYFKYRENDKRIKRKKERLKKINTPERDIQTIIDRYTRGMFQTQPEYDTHIYNYIYFEEEIKYYINKTRDEYLKITSNYKDKSYYRLIYYHLESVKSLDKMFLQRLQLSKLGYFYSKHSWLRSITGAGTTTSQYFELLNKNYTLIMGNLKSIPLNIINNIEEEFPKKINELDSLITSLRLREPYQRAANQMTEEDIARAEEINADNKAQIENIVESMKKVWDIVKDI